MKRICLSLVFMLCSLLTLNAQTQSPEQVAEHIAGNMGKVLHLDKEHIAIAQNIIYKKLLTVRTLSKQLPDDNVEKDLLVERRKFLTEIKAAFANDTQFQQWQSISQEQAQKIRKHEAVETPLIAEELLLF